MQDELHPRPDILQVHEQVPGLLDHPRLDRVPGGSEDAYPAGAVLNNGKDVDLGALAEARRLCRSARPGRGLVIVDEPGLHAFAVPGAAGRMVVSTGMLRSLDGAERRALLAHERSHLRHRHHLFLTALRLAAAVNPLLYPVFRAAVFTIERWADEDAAAAVRDRPLVARTLGKAALASLRHPAAALPLAAHHVPRRMQALLTDPPPRRTAVILALGAALLLITGLSLLEAAHDTERLFEAAMHTYQATHRQ